MSDFANMLQVKNQALFDAGKEFFLNELGLTQEEKDSINYHIKPRMRRDTYGHCNGMYHAPTNKLLRLDVTIANYGSVLGMLDVLAHELVHARQHLRGEFTWKTVEKRFLWFFKEIDYIRVHKGQVLRDTPYMEQKCEQEAFTLSHTLMTKFMAHLDKESKKLLTEGDTDEDEA